MIRSYEEISLDDRSTSGYDTGATEDDVGGYYQKDSEADHNEDDRYGGHVPTALISIGALRTLCFAIKISHQTGHENTTKGKNGQQCQSTELGLRFHRDNNRLTIPWGERKITPPGYFLFLV